MRWIILAGACIPGVASADKIIDVQAGFLFDSNLGNGQSGPDIRPDAALAVSLSAGQYIQIADKVGLSITADAAGEAYNQFTGMSNTAVGATVALRKKFGVGSDVPWARLSASAAHLDFVNTVRSGWRYRAGIGAGQRLGERWDLMAAFEFERLNADHVTPSDPERSGAVFDQTNRNLTVDATFFHSDKTSFSARYTRRDGDVAITTTGESASIDSVTTAETKDTVFGADATAYKLHATTHIAALGASYAVNAHSSLNLRLQRHFTYADGGNNYFKNVAAISYCYSF